MKRCNKRRWSIGEGNQHERNWFAQLQKHLNCTVVKFYFHTKCVVDVYILSKVEWTVCFLNLFRSFLLWYQYYHRKIDKQLNWQFKITEIHHNTTIALDCIDWCMNWFVFGTVFSLIELSNECNRAEANSKGRGEFNINKHDRLNVKEWVLKDTSFFLIKLEIFATWAIQCKWDKCKM